MQTATFGVIKSMELAKFLESMFASGLIGIYFIEVYQIHNKFLYVNQTRNSNRHTKRNVDSENYVNLEDCGYSFFDYKIAADTDFLIRALYKYELKVKYLKRYIVRMRMGGLSTDSSKRKTVWDEDIALFIHGFRSIPTKIMKIMWKNSQFIMLNFYKNKLEHFIAFLKASLQNTDFQSAETINWHNLLEFAREQAIVGVFWEGIQQLGNLKANKPTAEDVMEWMGTYQRITRRNHYVYAKTAWACETFQKEGFDTCILKGQGNALLYPDKYERTSGDIDIWLYPHISNKDTDMAHTIPITQRRKIITDYVRRFFPKANMRFHHVEFNVIKDLPIEVHFFPINMNNPWVNRKLQKWFETVRVEQFSNGVELQIKNTPNFFTDKLSKETNVIAFNAPTTKFNLVYQMCHILHHFFDDGIGLRQLIDYYYLLLQECPKQDKEEVVSWFKKLRIEGFARAVMYVQHEVLGIDPRHLLLKPDETRGKILLNEIISGGNFGKSFAFNHSTVANKYFSKIIRNFRLMKMCPSEALWEPWFRTWHFFWRILH